MKVKLEHDVQIRGDLKAKLYCYIDDDTKQPIVYTSLSTNKSDLVYSEQINSTLSGLTTIRAKMSELADEIVMLL